MMSGESDQAQETMRTLITVFVFLVPPTLKLMSISPRKSFQKPNVKIEDSVIH